MVKKVGTSAMCVHETEALDMRFDCCLKVAPNLQPNFKVINFGNQSTGAKRL